MTNKQVAQCFANGETHTIRGNEIKGSNMFIDGDTIYSYGYHFPIARNIGAYYTIFNSNGYSNSTSKHKGHVLSALMSEGKIIIEAPDCAIEKAEDYILSKIAQAQSKKNMARTMHMSDVWQYQTEKYQNMLQELKNLQWIKNLQWNMKG